MNVKHNLINDTKNKILKGFEVLWCWDRIEKISRIAWKINEVTRRCKRKSPIFIDAIIGELVNTSQYNISENIVDKNL